jgi:hypothetical protein
MAVYTFFDAINPADPTFNQELGINDNGVIAAYNGNGAPGHPNQGYTTTMASVIAGAPKITVENFPGSVQTQVVGINNHGATVGFYSPTNNGSDANYGFWNRTSGTFGAVFDPNAISNSTPAVNQLLGINDHAVAAGFYNDADGNSHGYTYNLNTGKFKNVVDNNVTTASLTATAIDNAGDVAGFYVNGTGRDNGFLDIGGVFQTIRVPNFGNTQILGINANGTELVGQAFGNAGFTTGFVYDIATQKSTLVQDPNGRGATVVNGINDAGDLVGFYTNGAGNTIGMLATPTAAAGPSVAETGATAQSFDAYSLLAPNAGAHSSLHYENSGRGYEGLSLAAASH